MREAVIPAFSLSVIPDLIRDPVSLSFFPRIQRLCCSYFVCHPRRLSPDVLNRGSSRSTSDPVSLPLSFVFHPLPNVGEPVLSLSKEAGVRGKQAKDTGFPLTTCGNDRRRQKAFAMPCYDFAMFRKAAGQRGRTGHGHVRHRLAILSTPVLSVAARSRRKRSCAKSKEAKSKGMTEHIQSPT